MGDDMVEAIENIDLVLSILELKGYDEHPEVGPLIKETRQIVRDSTDCLTKIVARYG